MADKNLFLLEYKGATHELKFNLGTLKKMKVKLGKDPLRAVSDPSQDVTELAEAIVLGSSNLENVDELTPQQMTSVVLAFAKTLSSDEEVKEPVAGESDKDTQQTAHV